MSLEAQVLTAPSSTKGLSSLFHRVWPPVAIVFGLIVTVGWIGLLGYGIFELAF